MIEMTWTSWGIALVLPETENCWHGEVATCRDVEEGWKNDDRDAYWINSVNDLQFFRVPWEVPLWQSCSAEITAFVHGQIREATNLGKSAMARCCREWRLWRLLVTLSASLQAELMKSCKHVLGIPRMSRKIKKDWVIESSWSKISDVEFVKSRNLRPATSRKMIWTPEVGGTPWRSPLLARSLLGVKTNKDGLRSFYKVLLELRPT